MTQKMLVYQQFSVGLDVGTVKTQADMDSIYLQHLHGVRNNDSEPELE